MDRSVKIPCYFDSCKPADSIFSEKIVKIFLDNTLVGGDTSMLIYLYGNIIGILVIIMYCYRIEKRTFMSSAVHSMWNFVQGFIYGFNISGIPQKQSIFIFNSTNHEIFSGGNFGPEGSILTTIVLASVIIIAMLCKREKLIKICYKIIQ